MPGGELELQFVGAQDLYLVSNPQITFFKSVYKRYTNFSKEIKNISADSLSNTLSSFDNDITLKYKIDRDGDLLKSFYLEFDLPSIYSDDKKRFQWIKNLGEFIIKEINITGSNGIIYSRITGEYIHIYNNSNLSTGKKQRLDKLLGNTVDVYNPANVLEANGIYPSTTLPSSSDTKVNIPSIHGRKIIIPIPFWFNNHLGTSLPIIAMKNYEIKVEVKLRPLSEWYTVIDTYPLSDKFNSRVRPYRNEDKLSNFCTIASNDILNKTVVSARGEYVFLDTEERKKMTQQTEHKYLINQIQYFSDTRNVSINNETTLTLDLKDINHPVKRLWYFLRRKDNELVNDWSNFTFLNEDGLNPLYGNVISDTHHNYELSYLNNNSSDRIRFLTSSKDCDIIYQSELKFDGNSRYTKLPNEYFEPSLDIITQKEDNYLSSKGIYCISFDAKNLGDYQPSGSCNFSRINKKELILTLRDPSQLTKLTGNITQKITEYRIFVIAENINFFIVNNGYGNIEFSN
jgi:hypothetical protein